MEVSFLSQVSRSQLMQYMRPHTLTDVKIHAYFGTLVPRVSTHA